ncbi:single-stranded DNA-binding protein [Schleiferilactobacillus harbinensis]|uniref:ERF family protein n=1 Tax=Schleiferilactobacillus harbinensis TaxID=304207 RepID=UPI0021A8259E|nr:ERF family protein [Schleiferilactobacillus harbinensis]MCT2909281.1 single-stranded DNA-binding protein [Schleiferilactobacillus harbinensis]
MKHSDSIKNMASALVLFRSQLVQPVKDKVNPFLKNKYVPLEGVVEAVDKGIRGTGLSYTQSISGGDKSITVTTLIMHQSGEWLELDGLTLPMAKQDAQAGGSAITYARRYSLSAAFGITSDIDDDGDTASRRQDTNLADGRRSSGTHQAQRAQCITSNERVVLEQLVRDYAKQLGTNDAKVWAWILRKTKSSTANVKDLTPQEAGQVKLFIKNNPAEKLIEQQQEKEAK